MFFIRPYNTMTTDLPHITPGIERKDSMAAAGIKVLRLHYKKMLANKASVLKGDDVEAVHDMRVAIRRMRVAFRIFKPYYPKRTAKAYGKRFKAVGKVLGPLRDVDVLLEKTSLYIEEHPENKQNLAGIWDYFGKARTVFHTEAIEYLNGQQFSSLQNEFENFLGSEDLSSEPKVEETAAFLIEKQLSKVRGFEQDWQKAEYETLHRLRIAFKRLRYSIEFFEDVLGEPQHAAIVLLKQIQDHLGDLNDAHVALQMLSEMPKEYMNAQTRAYIEYRLNERDSLTANFPQIWQQFTSGDFEGNLGVALEAISGG